MQGKLPTQHFAIDLKLRTMVFLALGNPSSNIKTRGSCIGLVIDDLGSNNTALVPPKYAPIDDTSYQLTIDRDEESAFIRHIELQGGRLVPSLITLFAEDFSYFRRFAVSKESLNLLFELQLHHLVLGQCARGDAEQLIFVGMKIFDPRPNFFKPAMDQFADHRRCGVIGFPVTD